MGRRIHSAIGYGVLLTKEEIAKYTEKESWEKIEAFIKTKVERAIKTKKKLDDEYKKGTPTSKTSVDDDHLDDLLEMLDFKRQFDMRADEIDPECATIDYLVDHVQYPHNKEIGTYSFMGFLDKMRYDDSLDWEMLTVLGINQSTMENSEFDLTDVKYSPNVKQRLINEGIFLDESMFDPIHVEVPWFKLVETHAVYTLVRDGKKTSEKGYLPHRSVFDRYKDLKDDVISDLKEKKKKMFTSKEECRDFLITFFKNHDIREHPQHDNALFDWHAWHYDKGHEIVSILYPKIPFDRMRKYLLFWIC